MLGEQMASGFIVLPDGRCLARRSDVYDLALRAIANELEGEPALADLRLWLQALLPGAGDFEELGYGAWLRVADQEVIVRHLDMRQLSPSDQAAMCAAAIRAGKRRDKVLRDLAAMVEACQRGEPPLSNSDWSEVLPAEEERIGPGWAREPSGAGQLARGLTG